MNPFLISGYKRPEYFCNREAETKKLINAIANSRNITLVAERRLGKTALIRHVQNKVKSKNIFLYVDLYPTLCLKDFIILLSGIVLHELEPFSEKIIRKISHFFSSLKPRFSFDPQTGTPNLELTINNTSEAEKSVSLLFDYIRQTGKKIIIAFDEFQQILNYPEKNIEAILRSEIQKYPDSCFIFSGSQTHLILSMFNEYSRPFYQSTEILSLGNIEKSDYSKFIMKHFLESHKKIELNTSEYIYQLSNGITYNVQYMCNKLFSLDGKEITKDIADWMLEEILKENEIMYYNYRELVTKIQYKILKAIAKEKVVYKPLSNIFITKYDLGSTSSVKTAIDILIKKGLLTNNRGLKVTDWYFSLWLAK